MSAASATSKSLKFFSFCTLQIFPLGSLLFVIKMETQFQIQSLRGIILKKIHSMLFKISMSVKTKAFCI